ncbi:Fur family transcriptional regulator [Aneurinibacillus uraniidurans]|uniref:Fur family transcriptional regulator n=1 Tax=Aneurinibacillus uraniidurans TaxID=2966586 RepID=UPI0023495F79|nr:Fur family transcriptional regulator [Aneurinibacillus sp. B1]WCN37584.1 Fur family transcriptional regulator [Aneurinibacillus sp. B1]
MTVEQALQLLKEKGYKYTGKREEMVRIFAQEKRYMSAREMLSRMQKEYPALSFDTVYRNLTLFADLNIVEVTELGGERKYRFRCSMDEHHHHLICLSCGKTRHIRSCPLDGMFGEPDGFRITDHKFEIYGYCSDCEESRV